MNLSFTNIEAKFKAFVLSDPDTSVGLGDTQFLSQLGDPSLVALTKDVQQAKELIGEISECLNSENLSFDENLDLDLMMRHLQIHVFFSELKQHGQLQRCRKPNGVDGISAGIFQLFVNDERDDDSRLSDILKRLQQAPEYLINELAVISEPITRWRDIELEQGEGLPDLFATILDWAKQSQFSQIEALQNAINHTNQALESYLLQLKQKSTIDGFVIGEDKVNELLALRQIHQSPQQLASMAKTFMQDTQTLLKDLTTRLISKYQLPKDTSQETLHEYLNEQFAAKLKAGRLDSVLDYYTDQIQSIEAFISKNKLFDIPAAQSMKIMQTPSFLEPVIPAGAMWPPLALREGNKTSLVYLTLKHDQLAEHTELGIPVMMIHEGIPGHHLQFATAALHPSFVRRIYSANEHAEGWTTMLEDYMLDVGYIEKDLVDEVRFIAKREMSRLVARVGIDLYFMTGNKQYLDVGLDIPFDSEDVFENAAKLLKQATGFTDGRVQAELNWYSTEQGYPLSYLTGNRLVWQLKQDLSAANKKQLDQTALDQAFHRVYLQSGCMPVNSLRKVFENEGYL
ncbi:MAG: DUF885 family protein [Gammaproteobacteria bacterium]|nr:DUF885 family protein [Gammaproteobacteria bacterium]